MSAGIELVLGTAQFGMAYGVAGRAEVVPPREVREILDLAFERGIRRLDTAPSYGDIEERLAGIVGSRPIRVMSKIPALPEQAGTGEWADLVVDFLRRSRRRLGDRLDTVLFHRADDLLGPGGAEAWDAASMEARGSDLRLGVSCYGPGEAIAVRERFDIRVAQVPGNVLDQRLLSGRVAEQLRDVEIHLRSVFLQGLLLMPHERAAARLPPAADALAAWSAWRSAHGIDALRGALGFAKSLTGLRGCVVGVDGAAQLREICDAWEDAGPLVAPVATDDEQVIDPRQWKAQA